MTEHYELLIPGLRLWVSLGCGLEEQANPQPVDVNIRLMYAKEPLGCSSDQLSDVCCYKTVSEKICESVRHKTFHLIESLAAHIFGVAAKAVFLKGGVVEVTVAKPNHPVPHVLKPIQFTYRRRLP